MSPLSTLILFFPTHCLSWAPRIIAPSSLSFLPVYSLFSDEGATAIPIVISLPGIRLPRQQFLLHCLCHIFIFSLIVILIISKGKKLHTTYSTVKELTLEKEKEDLRLYSVISFGNEVLLIIANALYLSVLATVNTWSRLSNLIFKITLRQMLQFSHFCLLGNECPKLCY